MVKLPPNSLLSNSSTSIIIRAMKFLFIVIARISLLIYDFDQEKMTDFLSFETLLTPVL